MANLNDDFNEIYNCQVCFEPYDEVNKVPILLNDCQHSVCKGYYLIYMLIFY